MARTTGYTCTAAVNLVLKGMFSRRGICPPEYLGDDQQCFDFVLDYLKQRGVVYHIGQETINS
jgi:saccharopine dehydrogenase-like NADP-dependent oxidoreductase